MPMDEPGKEPLSVKIGANILNKAKRFLNH
jgi:hypothetical protein